MHLSVFWACLGQATIRNECMRFCELSCTVVCSEESAILVSLPACFLRRSWSSSDQQHSGTIEDDPMCAIGVLAEHLLRMIVQHDTETGAFPLYLKSDSMCRWPRPLSAATWCCTSRFHRRHQSRGAPLRSWPRLRDRIAIFGMQSGPRLANRPRSTFCTWSENCSPAIVSQFCIWAGSAFVAVLLGENAVPTADSSEGAQPHTRWPSLEDLEHPIRLSTTWSATF
jgi:hypothetical protein